MGLVCSQIRRIRASNLADTRRNMFLAAAPYFQSRFSTNQRLLDSFQSSELTVSTVTNLASITILTKLQKNASYPGRIAAALILNVICFALLALFTVAFLDISAEGYYAFLMIMVLVSSVATGLCQNGVFAYASSFGVPEYTQAIMTGQGIAGVLPPIVKIASALSVSRDELKNGAAEEDPRSACAYFGTAAGVSAVALLAFGYIFLKSSPRNPVREHVDANDASGEDMTASFMSQRKVLGLRKLFMKLKWLALGVTITFAVTLASFPVFTGKIVSVRDPDTSSRIFQPAAFIPLGFLFWNVGDLAGRTFPLIPGLNLVHMPKTVFTAAILRVLFVPLYLLCNIKGQGAIISSDFFYLFVVQLLFGVTNGWLGSTCMMGAVHWVEEEEGEAAGAFMSLMLVSGLAIGSMLSFAAA